MCTLSSWKDTGLDSGHCKGRQGASEERDNSPQQIMEWPPGCSFHLTVFSQTLPEMVFPFHCETLRSPALGLPLWGRERILPADNHLGPGACQFESTAPRGALKSTLDEGWCGGCMPECHFLPAWEHMGSLTGDPMTATVHLLSQTEHYFSPVSYSLYL